MTSTFPLHTAAAAGDLSRVDELLSGGRQGGIRLHVDDLDAQGRWRSRPNKAAEIHSQQHIPLTRRPEVIGLLVNR